MASGIATARPTAPRNREIYRDLLGIDLLNSGILYSDFCTLASSLGQGEYVRVICLA